jgi:hypothetical protein
MSPDELQQFNDGLDKIDSIEGNKQKTSKSEQELIKRLKANKLKQLIKD